MKKERIITKEINRYHPGQKPHKTDQFYQKLANQLQDGMYQCKIAFDEFTLTTIHRAAIMLTCYLEDIVADSGPWRIFSQFCQEKYGHPVPIYHQAEEYYPDEPSLNAVRYIIWSAYSDVSDNIVYADGWSMDIIASAAYRILDEAFEEAPVNNQLSDEIGNLVSQASQNFNSLRKALMWLYNDCYLTQGKNNEKLFQKIMEQTINMEEMPLDPSMSIYYASVHCIFAYKVGPLALYPKNYLASFMRIKGMEQQADEVDKIEVLPVGTYKFDFITQERLLLTRTNGRELEIQVEELNLSQKILEEHDCFMASNFVYYQQEWHLNGLIAPYSGLKEKWEQLCEDDPEYLRPGTQTLTAEMVLERTSGQRIAYFKDMEELKDFMVEKIRFPRDMVSSMDKHGGELPTIYIDPEEPLNCLHTFFGYSPYIADPDNPYYDAVTAKEKAINILWDAEAVTTHAVNYLLSKGFLPDIYADDAFSRHNTTEQTRADIDFLMRYWRRENY